MVQKKTAARKKTSRIAGKRTTATKRASKSARKSSHL